MMRAFYYMCTYHHEKLTAESELVNIFCDVHAAGDQTRDLVQAPAEVSLATAFGVPVRYRRRTVLPRGIPS